MKGDVIENWEYDKNINTFFKRVKTNFSNPDYCKNKYGFDYPWWKKNSIIRPIIVAFNWYFVTLCCIALLMMLFTPVSAAQTLNSSVNITDITDTSITFEVKYKTDVRASGATFDGVEIVGYDLLHNVNYTAKELEPNTKHTFCIYKDLINCETGATTITKQSIDYITDFIWEFILIIAIIICLFLAIKYNIIGFVAFILACVGIMQKLNEFILIDKLEFTTFIMGTIYAIFAIAALFISFNNN